MSYVKWTIRLLLALLVGGFLHYTLPGQDVVRIVSSEVRLQEVAGWTRIFWNSAEPTSAGTQTRDVKFISGIREGGGTVVYRNEDTGWGWPPYYKFNSSDVQAEAADLESTGGTPQWVVVRHYGWRNQLLSIYPNVINMRPVPSPDVRLIPYFNIVVLAGLAAIVLTLRWLWRRFRRNRIDPIVRDVAEAFEPEERGGLTGKPFRGRRERLREWWTELVG